MVVIVFIAVLATAAAPFLNNAFNQYLSLQEDGMQSGTLAVQTQRIANVMRGAIDVTQATADEVTMYTYFSPNDAYVSQIHYYKTDSNTKLKADVIPLDANPPVGVLQTAQQRTYTIIDSFSQVSGVDTFEYLDSVGTTLSLPVTDLTTIKGMRVNLAVQQRTSIGTTTNRMSLEISMRNKKTNL